MTDDNQSSESLSESTSFPSRPLASLVASKIYYHLGNLDEALTFALGAGKLFDVDQTELGKGNTSEVEYVETVIGKFSFISTSYTRSLGLWEYPHSNPIVVSLHFFL